MAQVEAAVIGHSRVKFERPEVRIDERSLNPRIGRVRHFADRQQLQVLVSFADPRHLYNERYTEQIDITDRFVG